MRTRPRDRARNNGGMGRDLEGELKSNPQIKGKGGAACGPQPVAKCSFGRRLTRAIHTNGVVVGGRGTQALKYKREDGRVYAFGEEGMKVLGC